MRPEPLDSLTNFVNERYVPVRPGETPNILNYKRYIGQLIYFLPKSSRADEDAKKKSQVHRYYCFYRLGLKQTESPYTYSETMWVNGREKTERKTTVLKTDRYMPVLQGNNSPKDAYFHTPADSLEGCCFVIMDRGVGSLESRWGRMDSKEEERFLHKLNYHPLTAESQKKYSGQGVTLIFTLQPLTGGEPFLMELGSGYQFCDRFETEHNTYHGSGSYPPPMLLVSFFERMQRDHVGKSFIARNQISNLIDINTGQQVTIPSGSEWKCTDLSLMELSEAYMQPCFVLENETSAVKFTLLNPTYKYADRRFPYGFISKERYEENERKRRLNEEQRERERQEEEQRRLEAEKQYREGCLAEFGPTHGKYIAAGQVVVGMTAEMCEAAWGTPRYVNTTVVNGLRHEQWVYSYGNYLLWITGNLRPYSSNYN